MSTNWIKEVRTLGASELMDSAFAQVTKGNFVKWPVTTVTVGDLEFEVFNNYFSVGDFSDYIIFPLDGLTAKRVAEKLNCVLPTKKMVDLIWKSAKKVTPRPMGPPEWPYDKSMMSVERFVEHSNWCLKDTGGDPNVLVAGHKKDVVSSNRLFEHPGRVAIYGWHRLNGVPIQGPNVSIHHEVTYYDYSHGIRFCLKEARLKGQKADLGELLRDPTYCNPLSDEGTVDVRSFYFPPAKRIDIPSTIRQGSKGPTVSRWQQIIGAVADGIFGAQTERLTKAWQKDHGLVADGIVGPLTWRMALGVDVPQLSQPKVNNLRSDERLFSKVENISFLQARNYTPVVSPPRSIDLVVIHTMEAIEHPQTAENVAAWFAGKNAPRASSHYNIDEDSIVQSVLEKDVAWCAPGTNHNGIHLEHAGYSHQKNDETGWQDAYSQAMLARSARLCADICRRYGIPVVFVDRNGLLKGERGITYHREVSFACQIAQRNRMTNSHFFNKNSNRPLTDHGDPGLHFPLQQYFEMVNYNLKTLF